MRKEELRKAALDCRRKAHSFSVSARICRRAAALPAFRDARSVMLYISTGTEVDTALLLALCRQTGKRVSAPRVLDETSMEAAYIDAGGFTRGAFGIWEPLGEKAAEADLIFVPGVAFDKGGNRIGYGKGYYDRFLQNTNAVTVGLAYSGQIFPDIAAGPHDVRLDMILTEEDCFS